MSAGSAEESAVRTASELQPAMERFFDAIERRDLADGRRQIEEWCHPEIEFTSAIGSEIEGRAYLGVDGILAWFDELLEALDITYGDRDWRTPSDDVLVCLMTMTARGRGSGLDVAHEIGTVWVLEGGLVRKSRSYTSHAEALGAAEASGA